MTYKQRLAASLWRTCFSTALYVALHVVMVILDKPLIAEAFLILALIGAFLTGTSAAARWDEPSGLDEAERL